MGLGRAIPPAYAPRIDMGAWRAPKVGFAAATIAVSAVIGGCSFIALGPRIEIPLGMPHRMSIDQG